jgi:hypothetical protein
MIALKKFFLRIRLGVGIPDPTFVLLHKEKIGQREQVNLVIGQSTTSASTDYF